MQVSVEILSGLERRLTINVGSDTFEQKVTERLQKAGATMRLPGFRPGKVPLKEVRRRYGKSVRHEVAGEIMQSNFIEAVSKEELSPASQPSLEMVTMDPGSDLEFTATFEVYPQINLGKFSEVSVNNPEAELSDDDLDAMIERLREQRKTWEDVERAAEDGDQVTLDFAGYLDDELFNGGEGKDVAFVVGQGQMIEDFDKAVLGLKVGDKHAFDAHFPEDYRAEELQDKDVEFKVEIKKVAESKVPEVDETFIKEFGVENGTMESFREEVLGNMRNELDAATKTQVKQQVLSELDRMHELQVPNGLVDQEIKALKQQMMGQMQMGGPQQQLPELDDELFREEGERRVRVGLLINEVIQTNELKVEEDAVKERIETLANSYADPEQVKTWYYNNQEQLNQIHMALLEDSAIDTILNEAAVTPIKLSYDQVISGEGMPKNESLSDESQSNEELEDVK